MKEKNAESIAEIDKFELDREWVQQPKLYEEWAIKSADARQEVDDAKNNLELVTAELSLKIREDPTSYDLEKPTEKGIETVIITQSKYQKAVKRLIEAKHQSGLTDAITNALEHRKKALENLVYLHGQSYFAKPQIKDKDKQREIERRAVRKRRD